MENKNNIKLLERYGVKSSAFGTRMELSKISADLALNKRYQYVQVTSKHTISNYGSPLSDYGFPYMRRPWLWRVYNK